MGSNFILCDKKEDLCREWSLYFASYNQINICHDFFFQIPCQAVVSPANSSGTMRGGLDYYLSIFFDENTPGLCREFGVTLAEALRSYHLAQRFFSRLDWTMEKKVKEKIYQEQAGYLPVGQALVVETDNIQIPFLIVAPTMGTPQDIQGTHHAYLATKAIIAIAEEKGLSPVLVPGLGTGTGGLSSRECAQQMEKAFAEAYVYKK